MKQFARRIRRDYRRWGLAALVCVGLLGLYLFVFSNWFSVWRVQRTNSMMVPDYMVLFCGEDRSGYNREGKISVGAINGMLHRSSATRFRLSATNGTEVGAMTVGLRRLSFDDYDHAAATYDFRPIRSWDPILNLKAWIACWSSVRESTQ